MMSTIFADYHNWLWKTATGILHPSHRDLEDLVQEGRIALWRAYESYDPNRGALPFWLTFKARGRMIEVATQKKWVFKPVPIEPELLHELPVSGHEDAVIAYHTSEIKRALDKLSPAQHKYVVARFWCDMNDQDMIDFGIFGYDAHALWSRSGGARDKLQKELSHLAKGDD